MPIPEKFKSWFEELCKECGVPDIALAYEESAFGLGEIPFLFADSTIDSEGKLLAQAIISPLPAHGAAEMMRRMLHAQLLLAGQDCPQFALEPDANMILLITPVDAQRISPKEAAVLLQHLAKAAFVWREVLQQSGPLKMSAHQQKLLETVKK